MTKNYEVKLTAYATVVVFDAASPEEAMEYAIDETSSGDYVFDTATIECELSDDDAEDATRHAEAVSRPHKGDA